LPMFLLLSFFLVDLERGAGYNLQATNDIYGVVDSPRS
jgi:hypothetical protein